MHLITNMFISPLDRRYKWYRNGFVSLFPVTLVILGAFMFLLIVYVVQPSSTSYQDQTARQLSGLCQSQDCVLAAAEIIESVDENVDPCQDFYSFACNGWIEKHPIPKARPSFQQD
jgi:hypothetical protein